MVPLFLAVLANVVGLGVVVPLLPFYAEAAGAAPGEVALLFAVFSGAQFLTAPLWGRLSDRIGRRPVMAISFAGSALAYLWLAAAGSLGGIFLARAFAGIMNGWLATGQAYVADVTSAERRARGMGLFGAAFGLGFVIGPALGGYLVGGGTPDFRSPILISAASSALAFAVAMTALPEPARRRNAQGGRPGVVDAMRETPALALLVALYLAMFFVFSGMESVFAMWCGEALAMGPRSVGYYLAFAGVCGIVIQGWLVGRLAARFGETRVVVAAMISLAAGLALLPAVTTPPLLVPVIALISLGFSLGNPSLLSLISRTAPPGLRGGTLGIGQSASSLGRILGPSWSGYAFSAFGRDWPFFSGALLLLPVILVAALFAGRITRAT